MNPEPSPLSGIKRKIAFGAGSLMTLWRLPGVSGRARQDDDGERPRRHRAVPRAASGGPSTQRISRAPGSTTSGGPSYPGRRGDRCWSTGRSRRQSSRSVVPRPAQKLRHACPQGGSPGVGRHAYVRAQDPVGVRPVQRRGRERPTKRRRSARRTWTRLDTVAEKGTQKHKSPTVSGTVGLQHFGSCGGRI